MLWGHKVEILKVNNLSKVYGKGDTQIKALDDVSFSSVAAPGRDPVRSLNTSRKLYSRWGASSVIKVKYGATKPYSSSRISLG